MSRLDELFDLFAYHRWANARMLDATAGLSQEVFDRDLGNSFPSIRATLAHVLGADWVWLERWEGNSPKSFPDWDVSTHALLRAKWAEVEARQLGWLGRLREVDLDRLLAYQLMSGAPHTNPLGELCRHVVNHGTYHRGQVVTMLRQVGATPPWTDFIVYLRERPR